MIWRDLRSKESKIVLYVIYKRDFVTHSRRQIGQDTFFDLQLQWSRRTVPILVSSCHLLVKLQQSWQRRTICQTRTLNVIHALRNKSKWFGHFRSLIRKRPKGQTHRFRRWSGRCLATWILGRGTKRYLEDETCKKNKSVCLHDQNICTV